VIDALRLLAGDPEQVEAEKAKSAAALEKAVEKEADRRAADREKAAAGDKRAAARVDAETDVVGPAQAAEHKRQVMLDAMKDEEFPERFERLKREAQDAVYTKTEDTVGEPHEGNPNTPEVGADGAWQCPKHGQAITKVSTRRQREYQGCPVEGCGEFERL
jgi:hypothetical protein